jgi:hypothetical protein
MHATGALFNADLLAAGNTRIGTLRLQLPGSEERLSTIEDRQLEIMEELNALADQLEIRPHGSLGYRPPAPQTRTLTPALAFTGGGRLD